MEANRKRYNDQNVRIPGQGEAVSVIDLTKGARKQIKKVNNDAQESKNRGVLAGRPCRDWEQARIQVLKFTWKLLR
jgi:hypothetical protein